MKHLLVLFQEDDHFDVYGIFGTIEEFIAAFNVETLLQRAKLLHSYKILEMEGKTIIDETYVEDLQDSLEVSEEVFKIIRNGT